MSSSEESSGKSVRKTKKVVCKCPKCQGKYVDPRTQQSHMALPDIGQSSRITKKSSTAKYKHREEPLPEFPKRVSSGSEDSDNDDSDDSGSDNSDSDGSGSDSSDSDGSGSDNSDSDGSGSDISASDSNSSEEDGTASDEEDNTNSSTESVSLFLEDDFIEQSPTSRKSGRAKFQIPSPIDAEEMNIDEPLEESSPFDIYQPSDDDEIMIIQKEEPDDASSSSNSSSDSASDSSQASREPVNFIPPEIDPEVFDQPFTLEDNLNDWIILWIMKYQQRFNISDVGTETLIKFLRIILVHFKMNEADKFPTSLTTAKSSLGILTKYKKYVACPKCHKLYDLLEIKNYSEGNRPVCKMCTYVEYPNHRSESRRSACNEPLAEIIKTNEGTLLRALKLYPVGSIKQQLYMMYQRPGFEELLRHSRNRNVPNGIFSDIYEGNIWKNFAINPDDPTPFFTNDTLDSHIGLAMNIDWFQPFDYTIHSTGVIYGVLCNLPREERFKTNNILTLGIIPGPNEPSKHQINHYLAPIVDELIEFSSGIELPSTFEYKEGRKIYAALILSANDVPAARKICGHASYLVKCHRCPKRSKYDRETKRNHYGGFENMDEWFKPVDISQYFSAANQWLLCTNKQEREKHVSETGVRWSELYRLNYFDPVKFMVVDPMHCLFLGIGKWIMKQCLLDHGKLSKKQLSIIERRMSNIKIPSDIGRIPSKVARGAEGFSRFTADQWRIFYQVYAIPCMWDLLAHGDKEIIFNFVCACNSLVSRIVRQSDLDEAHNRLINMAQLIQQNYGPHLITSNIHLSLHIKQCCLDYGPPYAYWCYSFERMNGLLGSYPTSNRSIEPELMRILMKNAQVEYRINSVNSDETELLFGRILPLLDKKVRGSLKMTENFESEDLIAYLDMADKITIGSDIMGTERYPGEMLRPINENVNLPDNIYQILGEYYSTLYDFDLDDMMAPSIDRVITQFGRLKMGAEIYGSKNAVRYRSRSYIRAKFLAYRDNSQDIYPGQIQYFFQHKFNNETHHLAYVRWYMPHSSKRFYLSLQANNDKRCDIEIWQEKFYEEARDCILPIQRILGRFIPSSYKFQSGNNQQKILVVIPTNKRFNI